ncbi:Chaperone protein dnaJ 49 [Linum grandiflorum]
MDTEEEEEQQKQQLEQEATRLKSVAEAEFSASNLKSALKHAKKAHRLSPNLDGLSPMLTSLKILRFANSDFDDWYSILQVDPFSHITTIKKQYKKLALLLHPDKNSFPGCEDAFKLLGQALRVLSDKIARKDFDSALRLRIQEASTAHQEEEEEEKDSISAVAVVVETFWTSCSRCRLLHQFDRQYVGQYLVCPNCNKSFEALEVEEGNVDEGSQGDCANGEEDGIREWDDGSLRIRDLRRKRSHDDKVLKKTVRLDDDDDDEEMMTLAELQLLTKRKACKKNRRTQEETQKKSLSLQKCTTEKNLEIDGPEMMEVEDSDFYDFDIDRGEKSFKKGQVWGIYDDIDGMPRHYGLIDEVVSVNPFEVKLSWLDLVDNGDHHDERLISWGKVGLQVSCGSFKVARTTSVDSLNIFSHLLTCERAAREIYRIYPNKGSVWGVYSGSGGEEPSYEFVVVLSNYSDLYGLSMAYLDKVDGFKTVFKRREIGFHAVKHVKKDGLEVFSHQIPARKLSTEEMPELPRDCWELDPASLPSVLLRIGNG